MTSTSSVDTSISEVPEVGSSETSGVVGSSDLDLSSYRGNSTSLSSASDLSLGRRRKATLESIAASSSHYAVFGSSSTDAATPTSLFSDFSEAEFLSPNSLAQSGKRFWTDSSSWLLSKTNRLIKQTSLGNSSQRTSHNNLDSLSLQGEDRDPASVERSNLLNIMKLVIKELIDFSIRHGCSLESEHPPLQHFFIVLEHALRHGLKPKKGLLGPKKELWDVLQLVEKCTPEAQDMTTSIRELPTVSTHIGRARAWLRMALMQKKLADYFKVLVDRREFLLVDYYDPLALIMCEEAPILCGLLVGLNVIDCNFCLKEEDLDSQQGVIDFSLYLRSSRSSDSPNEDLDSSQLDNVLDQKNYIEELNRHLNATVTNLQSRVENLTATNALLKEDLAISKNSLLDMQDENRKLKLKLTEDMSNCGRGDKLNSPQSSDTEAEAGVKLLQQEQDNIDSVCRILSCSSENLSVANISKRLLEERHLRLEAQRECDNMRNHSSEMQLAMQLMEKDVHEKQDTIISLRKQLEEIKGINLDMYRKLQENERILNHKTDLVMKLESKCSMLDETIARLDEKVTSGETQLKIAQETIRNLGQEVESRDLKVTILEGDLKMEREKLKQLESKRLNEKALILDLNAEIQQLQIKCDKTNCLEKEVCILKRTCKEHEETLADMGEVLSESKLKVEDMKEASKAYAEAQWTDDKLATNCKLCLKEFGLTRRKHHCRNCGEIYCNACSDNSVRLPSSAKPTRVCDTCYTLLLHRCSASSIAEF